MDTIGFLELTSIASGIEVVDSMLKTANVDLIFAKASCPGKYYIMISGNVGNVKASINQGIAMGKNFVVDSLVLPKIDPQVIQAINMSSSPTTFDTIGVLEYFSVTASLIAADIAVKSSNVKILDVRLGTGIGGKSFVVLTGDTAAVSAAVESASKASEENGMLLNKIVVPKPRKELIESLF